MMTLVRPLPNSSGVFEVTHCEHLVHRSLPEDDEQAEEDRTHPEMAHRLFERVDIDGLVVANPVGLERLQGVGSGFQIPGVVAGISRIPALE